MRRTAWIRPLDWIPVGICLCAAVGMLMCAVRVPGQTLRVTTPTQDMVFPLSQDMETTVIGHDGRQVVVCIEDGCAFVRQADCPDQVCVKTGRLSVGGQTAACLPSGVVLIVQGGAGAPDAVAR